MACCRLKHVPTGIVATAQTRSRKTSLSQAMQALKQRVTELETGTKLAEVNNIRKEQVGTGQRGDKIRTIQFQNNSAVDHRTGKRCTSEQYLRGEMHKLWP